MIKHDLEKLNKNKAKELVKALNPLLSGADFDRDTTRVMGRSYSFYPGYIYIHLTEHISHPPREISLLAAEEISEDPKDYQQKDGESEKNLLSHMADKVFVFDGTNEPVYRANMAAPIDLNEDNIKEYVRFFFSHVRGRHGRFSVIESVDEIDWREDPPPAARKTVGKMITPVTVTGPVESDKFYLRVCFIFKDSLFKARVTVDAQGQVDITEEEIIIEDMPVFDDTLAG